MKLGVFSVLLSQKPLPDALDYISGAGCEAVEIGCGNYTGKTHCDPDILLKDEGAFDRFKDEFERRGLIISGLSCHGNPLHPNKKIAQENDRVMRQTILLAERLGQKRVIAFSGCPGDSDNAKYPNWVTCPWPPDYSDVLKWQWEKRVVPYWKKMALYARDHGVSMICLEMHPGFVVYNPETLLRLRAAVGKEIGVNLDPSHLFWQGIDPIAAIRELKGVIYHVHAKDTKIDTYNTAINGVLDNKHYGDELHRSWIFRTVGYGHGFPFWKDFISTLRMVGYDHVLSIEHEDSLMSMSEGLNKAVKFLKEIILIEEKGKMWWA